MDWKDFEHQGVTYSLAHLHAMSFDLVVPAQGEKPERRYRINTNYSMHCFTRGPREGEVIPPDLAYSDSRETRIFDFDRYNRSRDLPEIIQTLSERPCFHDTHGNFYVFEVVDEMGVSRYYSVFFALSKAGKKAGLNLTISSAYVKNARPYAHSKKPIRFRVLVHNTWVGKKVAPAP